MAEAQKCEACRGAGWWEVECCSGAGGCSCGGEAVHMGDCRVCGGSGELTGDDYDPLANINLIRGLHFIGSGGADTHGIWPNRGNYGRR